MYLVAFLLICSGWIWFNYNQKHKKSHIILAFTAIGAPLIFHFLGLQYASFTSSQGAAFVSAFLLLVLIANSVLLIIFMVVSDAKKNRSTQ